MRLSHLLVALSMSLSSAFTADGTVFKQNAYRGMCDASAAVPVGADRFAVASDEDSKIRIYHRDVPGLPLQIIDLASSLRLDPKSPETDLEGAAQIGDVVYWITSHGRNKSARERLSRHRFFATRLTAEEQFTRLVVMGKPYEQLLRDLTAAPQLKKFKLAQASARAPKDRNALNIEGLAASPDGELLIGFRNPIPERRALIVPLQNPRAVIEGTSRARLGEPILLDLGGLGIRDMVFAEGRYWIVAGPHNGNKASQLFMWNGPGSEPSRVPLAFGGWNPEALVFYADRPGQVQVLSDDGPRDHGGTQCKALPDVAARAFRSGWVRLP